MFDPALLLTYIAACFLFSTVPGPSVTVVVANSLARGVGAGLLVILGTQISLLSMVLVVALGLEAVVTVVGEVFVWIKLAGALYLIWLGWRMFSGAQGLKLDGQVKPKSAWAYVVEGALVNWSNPKTLLFLGAFLPQFVDPAGPAFEQTLVLGVIVMAVATITDTAYAVVVGRARHIVSTARLKLLSRVSGVILMAGGVWLALQQRH